MHILTESEDLARRADDLAGEAFDTMDANARDWIADSGMCGYPEDCISLIVAACSDNEDDLRAAIARLRERFVDYAADLYRVQAQDEIKAAAEFASEEAPL
jgi:hypothetical protein